MLNITKEHLRTITRRFWGGVFTLVIALAVLVQLGREAFPLLNDYSQEISEHIGQQLGVNISVGEVSAKWEGMVPEIELHDVVVESEQGVKIFNITKARAEVNLLDSLIRRRLYWQRINLEDLKTSAYQDKNGQWKISGLETESPVESGFTIDDPLDVFLFGRRVEIGNLQADLTFRTGHKTRLLVPSVNIENDEEFHRIVAQLEVDDDAQAVSLVVEANGDPRNHDSFHANAYLDMQDFPMEKVLAAVGADFWDDEKNDQWREGHRLDLSLWIQGSPTKGLTAKGQMRADGLPVKLPEEFSLPTELSSDIYATWHGKEGWSIGFQQLAIAWQDIVTPSTNIKVYGKNQSDIGIGVDTVNLQDWMESLRQVGLEKSKAGEIVSALSPSGMAENIDIKIKSAEEGYFLLRANLIDAGTEAFKGSPRFSRVNAFAQASAFEGYVDVDSTKDFEVFFEKIYESPFDIAEANGRVAWKIDRDKKLTYLASSILNVKSGEDELNGQFYTEMPFKREYGEPLLTIVAGLNDTSAKNYKKYLPFTLPKSLQGWLHRSIGDGQLSGIEFLYDGSVRKKSDLSKTYQLVAELKNGNVAFDEAWPTLRQVDASIYLDNNNLNVDVSNASLLGNRVSAAQVSLVEPENKQGLSLLIKGQLDSDAEAAMTLLQNSPVRHAIGKTFDNWIVKGDVNANIELLVPLSENVDKLQQSVKVDFSRAELSIPDLNLAMKSINGDISFTSDKGLHSKNLSGRLWGEKFSATISSPENKHGRKETEISFNGPVDIEDLYKWTDRPELLFVNGKPEVTGKLVIPDGLSSKKKLKISMHSDMQGVSLDLPAPVTKLAEEEKPFDVNISVYEDRQVFKFTYDDWVSMNIVRGAPEMRSTQIVFGNESAVAEPGFFDIRGQLENFDLMEWSAARAQYYEFLSRSTGEGQQQTQPLPIRLELNVNSSKLGTFAIDDLQISGFGTQRDWTLFFNSEFLRGRVITYDQNRPVFMDLDHLRFPALEKDESLQADDESGKDQEDEFLLSVNKSLLARFDLKQAVPVDFSTKEFSLGKENYGSWSFNLLPIEDGVKLDNIVARVRGLEVGGEVKPAQFIWKQVQGENSSRFNGGIRTGNIASVTSAWEIEKIMESRSAEVDIAAQWPGAPDEVNLRSIEGLVSLNILDGNFVRGAKAGENPLLRLIALFNFDTLARRLRLDFSDLAKQGFAFDKVVGELNFKDGDVVLDKPLVVESTSSSMQLAGTIDMVDEKIDADLVVTLPVASNLAVLTAVTAGLPAGVGVYLVSKLFKKQVDKVSSISYSVTGKWNDSKIKVRRILNNSAAANRKDKKESSD